MKILHIAPNAYPFLGGIEVLLKNFTKYERDHSNNTYVISFPDRSHKFDGEYKVEGTRVLPLPVLKEKVALPFFPKQSYRPMEIASIFGSYKEIIISERPDLIHFHDYSEASLPMMSIARSMGIKRIHHLHTLVGDQFPKDLVNNLKLEDDFIAVSKAVAKSIKMNVNSVANIRVVSNGIPEIDNEISKIKQDSVPTILMAGRCVPSKGFDTGLKAMVKVLEHIPDAKMIIAGYGKQFLTLQAIAKELGIQNSVQFSKGPHPDQVLELIKRSWVVLVPSKSEEGFSLVAAEAALCGKPVLATDIGGLPETVLDDFSGLIVSPGDLDSMSSKLVGLLSNSKLRDKLGQNAAKRGEIEFSMKRFSASLSSIYREILDINSDR